MSVINMKGGVGKTTAVARLGQYANRMHFRVLAVGLDPRANLSRAFMGNAYVDFLESEAPSIVEDFDGYRPPTRNRQSPTLLHPLDAVRKVFQDEILSYIPSRFDFSDNLVKAVKPDPQVLAQCIANHFQDRDLARIDCPPTESVFTRAAYHASRHVLVPVRPEYLATVGFPPLAKSLDTFKTENPSHFVDVLGVVINDGLYDGGNDGGPEKARAMEGIVEEAAKNRWHIFGKQVPHSRGFPKQMCGDRSYGGNSWRFRLFADEFPGRLELGRDQCPGGT